MSIIGNNIKARRLELRMTQEELANKMGYKTKSSINKIELGLQDIPQTKIKKFADVLLTTPGALMGWELTEEQEKNSDIMADIAVRMHKDNDFRELVEILYNLDIDKVASVKQMLQAFR